MEPSRPVASSRRGVRVGVVTSVIAATILGAGAVVAQSPGASPVPGTNAPAPQVSPDKVERGRAWTGGRHGSRLPAVRLPGIRNGGGERGPGPRVGQGFGRGDRSMRVGQRAARLLRSSITVTAVNAPTISLATDDGWTRDVDTTNVVITRGRQAITLADVQVGDTIRLAQTRNADGSYTVTGIQVQPAVTIGNVATIDTAGFTVTEADGSVVMVRVSDATRWLSRRGTVTGLDGLAVGSRVAAQGVRGADGSIDATVVAAQHAAATIPSEPAPSAAPEASTQG